MKLLIFAGLLMCASAVGAQDVAPPKAQLAQIDPAARDLLARVSARYKKFETFESLIIWRIGSAGKGLEPRRFRVQMTRDGRFVVGVEFPDKSWRKWICDGKTLVGFISKFPKRYVRQSLESLLGYDDSRRLEASLRKVGIDGPLISLMTSEEFGAVLLMPNFVGLEKSKGDSMQWVTILLRAPAGHSQEGAIGSVKMGVNPQNLMLDLVTVAEANAEVFTESYAQTRFNPTFNKEMFRAAAPLNYRLIDSFEPPGAVANAPVKMANPQN